MLVFLLTSEEGYATEIARFFGANLYDVQRQLDRLEAGGMLVSHKVGHTRVYTFNLRYPFLEELKALLERALTFYPEEKRARLLFNRRRPRRRGNRYEIHGIPGIFTRGGTAEAVESGWFINSANQHHQRGDFLSAHNIVQGRKQQSRLDGIVLAHLRQDRVTDTRETPSP